MSQNNVIDLNEFRKNKKPPTQKLMAFEPGKYYIYPDMGVLVHILFITDKSLTHKNQPIYVMEDQYGNLFAEVMDDETCIGWHLLQEEVFIEAHKRYCKNPDPPEPVAG